MTRQITHSVMQGAGETGGMVSGGIGQPGAGFEPE